MAPVPDSRGRGPRSFRGGLPAYTRRRARSTGPYPYSAPWHGKHNTTGAAAAAIGPGELVLFRSEDEEADPVLTTALASHDRRGLVLPAPHDILIRIRGASRARWEAQSSRRARTASSTRLP